MDWQMKYLNDIKTWVLAVIFFIGIGIAFAGFFQLPNRVEKVEEKTEKTEDNVQQLSQSLEKYLTKQEVLKEEQDKREQLMLNLIERMSQK